MISAIQREMADASHTMRDTQARMDDGVSQAEHTAQAISGIQDSMCALLASSQAIARHLVTTPRPAKPWPATCATSTT